MKANMEAFFADGSPSENTECEVIITHDRIVVSYDDNRPVIWEGAPTGVGHFELTCPRKRGRATLHRFPHKPHQLEGSWVEEGYTGMWRIDVDE
jgi:hypothetical protein